LFFFFFFFRKMESHELFARAGLDPWSSLSQPPR
jgi:hypothetical protein